VVSNQEPVASEIGEMMLAVIEKRPNKANLPMVLVVGG